MTEQEQEQARAGVERAYERSENAVTLGLTPGARRGFAHRKARVQAWRPGAWARRVLPDGRGAGSGRGGRAGTIGHAPAVGHASALGGGGGDP